MDINDIIISIIDINIIITSSNIQIIINTNQYTLTNISTLFYTIILLRNFLW